MPRLRHRLHAVVFPADDVPGTWIAHCLELDIVTCGNSPEHAMQMLDEALRLVAERRAQDGQYPFEFRSAPEEAWRKLVEADFAFSKDIDLPPVGDVTIDEFLAA